MPSVAALGIFSLRMYDQRLGRWFAADPYDQYHSPYLAMSNNPVSYTDPDGGTDGWFDRNTVTYYVDGFEVGAWEFRGYLTSSLYGRDGWSFISTSIAVGGQEFEYDEGVWGEYFVKHNSGTVGETFTTPNDPDGVQTATTSTVAEIGGRTQRVWFGGGDRAPGGGRRPNNDYTIIKKDGKIVSITLTGTNGGNTTDYITEVNSDDIVIGRYRLDVNTTFSSNSTSYSEVPREVGRGPGYAVIEYGASPALIPTDSPIEWFLTAGPVKATYNLGVAGGRMIGGYFGAKAATKVGMGLADDFLESATKPLGDQGLTTVGRALQKHAGREGSVFQGVKFSHKTANQEGLNILNQIMDSKNQIIQSAENGGKLIFDKATGRGFGVSREGLFNGFRELPK